MGILFSLHIISAGKSAQDTTCRQGNRCTLIICENKPDASKFLEKKADNYFKIKCSSIIKKQQIHAGNVTCSTESRVRAFTCSFWTKPSSHPSKRHSLRNCNLIFWWKDTYPLVIKLIIVFVNQVIYFIKHRPI